MIAVLRRDHGFTFTEMLVASALFSLVILVAGGIFLGQFRAQQQVTAVTGATTDAQIAANTIDEGIRNSSAFRVVPVGSDQLLVARVAGSATTLQWSCHAWYYSASEGTIRSSVRTPASAVAVPTAGDLASWTLLVDGVRPRGGSAVVFSESGATLSVAFDAATGDGYQPVAISFSSSPLAGVSEIAPCR